MVRRTERDNGPVPSPHHRFRMLMEDAAFQWMRPVSHLITKIDEATVVIDFRNATGDKGRMSDKVWKL